MSIHGNPNGDFVMYLYDDANADFDTGYVDYKRFMGRAEMEAEAAVSKKGGRFKRIWQGRWNEAEEADTIPLEDWSEGDDD